MNWITVRLFLVQTLRYRNIKIQHGTSALHDQRMRDSRLYIEQWTLQKGISRHENELQTIPFSKARDPNGLCVQRVGIHRALTCSRLTSSIYSGATQPNHAPHTCCEHHGHMGEGLCLKYTQGSCSSLCCVSFKQVPHPHIEYYAKQILAEYIYGGDSVL